MTGAAPPPPKLAADQPDLSICDREPITRLDRIQSFGFLVALADDWTIVRASENLGDFLGVSADEAIGRPFEPMIDQQAVHDIRNRMAALHATGAERLYGVALRPGKTRTFDINLHLSGDMLIMEGEVSQPDGRLEAASMVRAMIARLGGFADLDAFHRSAARHVRALTGFDRVMIYRFDEAGVGEVIADSMQSGWRVFSVCIFRRRISQRRPGPCTFAIPSESSRTSLRGRSRCMRPRARRTANRPVDGDSPGRVAGPYRIPAQHGRGRLALDLDHCRWPSVGLVACHNRTPRLPSFVMRTASELFGQMYSLTLKAGCTESPPAKCSGRANCPNACSPPSPVTPNCWRTLNGCKTSVRR